MKVRQHLSVVTPLLVRKCFNAGVCREEADHLEAGLALKD